MKITGNKCLLVKNNQITEHTIKNEVWNIDVGLNEQVEIYAVVFSGDLPIRVRLKEAGAKCNLKCVYLFSDENQGKISFDIIHENGQTDSTQMVNGIALEKSCVTFEGVIRIPFNSQQCDARQNHRAVVLSDTASVQAVPELEIYADDVTCAHGSAIGPLDKGHLFYLMSRGIPETQAKLLLLRSFIKETLHESFERDVSDWMDCHV